jgi:hypothetical protein
MRKSRLRSGVTRAFVLALAITIPLVPFSIAIEQRIDLDGNPLNGNESTVETNVLQSFPVQIENVIFNNATGSEYSFSWPGAGPGGFDAILTAGPGVGTKWTWTTVSQVYTIVSPAAFQLGNGTTDPFEMPVFGQLPNGVQGPAGQIVFDVPGKSIYPTDVSLSSASLTSSLVTFFSPENTLSTCDSNFIPGRFEQTITNSSGETLTFTVEEPDCCPEAQMTICEDGCQFYLTDDNNCGGCGITCAFDEFCDAGSCADICPGAGQEYCDGECADTFNDVANCGGCGITCAFDEFCDGGTCADICPGLGQEYCDGACADTLNDDSNCGGCGITCAFDEFCDAGTCADICPGLGQEYCDGACADTLNDAGNCGSCGTTCAFDEFCDAGACADICPGAGQEYCDGACADTINDPQNCGACGNICDANSVCADSQCVPCSPPFRTNCNNECVNLHTDPFNCGECGFVCDFSNCPSTGTGACSQGSSCVCDASPTSSSDSFSFAPTWSDNTDTVFSVPARRLQARFTARSVPAQAAPAVPQRHSLKTKPKIQRAPRRAPETRSTLGVVEAPVCGIPVITQEIPDGESYTLCQSGSRLGREIFTTVSVDMNGEPVGQGPCGLIVPDNEAVVRPFEPSTVSVIVLDESGDGLMQPGETAEVFIEVLNLGTAELLNPVAVLSSAPDQFNPLPLTFLNDTSVYPDFPALDAPADCESVPVFEPKTNTVAFTISVPAEQEADIGRLFRLNFQGDDGRFVTVEMPLVVGIGRACNPATDTDGETYDGLEGLLPPVDTELTPSGSLANLAADTFNHGSTIRLKFRLSCGSSVLGPEDMALPPRIASIVHETEGEIPLTMINADNNDNPNDPLFECGNNRCEFGLRTTALPPGTIDVSIKMPDSRVFHVAMTTVQ